MSSSLSLSRSLTKRLSRREFADEHHEIAALADDERTIKRELAPRARAHASREQKLSKILQSLTNRVAARGKSRAAAF